MAAPKPTEAWLTKPPDLPSKDPVYRWIKDKRYVWASKCMQHKGYNFTCELCQLGIWSSC